LGERYIQAVHPHTTHLPLVLVGLETIERRGFSEGEVGEVLARALTMWLALLGRVDPRQPNVIVSPSAMPTTTPRSSAADASPIKSESIRAIADAAILIVQGS
jgi:hypothetical protein